MKISDWLNDTQTIKLPKYVVAFDILNIISCFAVVALHVNGVFWRFSYDRYWITSNFIESLFYFAVPVFVMLSGATLINYRERYSTGEFFKRRVVKTFVPFVIWSGIAIVYNIIKDGMLIFGGSFSFKSLFEIIFFTRANEHYWFFITLFALYLSIPLLSAVETKKRKSVFTYTALVAILTYSILPLVLKLLGTSLNNAIQLPVAAGYVLYLLVGYLIANYPLSKTLRIIIYVFGVIGFALHFLGTHFLSYKAGAIDGTFKDYLNIPCVMFSIAVFVLVYYNRHLPKNKKVLSVIRAVSGASLGVYLCHKFVIDIILHLFGFDTASIVWRVFGTFAVYGICVTITLIIKKIPIFKNIVP